MEKYGAPWDLWIFICVPLGPWMFLCILGGGSLCFVFWSTRRKSDLSPKRPLVRAKWGPPIAEREAAVASCALVVGPPAAPQKPCTKGHSCPWSLLRVADWADRGSHVLAGCSSGLCPIV
eukprot:8043428-Pyramimonas_sp.AAC.1